MTLTTKLALCVIAAALSGCNMVMTQSPMFSQADRGNAPPIRPGVWREDKTDCTVDETLPQSKWPLCAGASPGVADPPIWLEVTGDPDLLQAKLPLPGDKTGKTYYVYLAFRPLKLDEHGRVVAMKMWPVRCGPPAPPEAPPPISGDLRPPSSPGLWSPTSPASVTRLDPPGPAAPPPTEEDLQRQAKLRADLAMLQEATVRLTRTMSHMIPTKTPLPGLTMDTELGSCTPVSVEALRNAAKTSEAWAEENANSHWVRERRPDDMPAASPTTILDTTSADIKALV